MTCSGDGQRGGHLNYTVRVCRLLLHRTHSGNGVALAAVPLQRSANNIAVMVPLSSVFVSQARSGRTMPGGTPAIAIRTSLTSFPPTSQPAQQPSKLDTVVLSEEPWSHWSPGSADGCKLTQFLYDTSSMGLDPYSGKKNVAITTLLGEFPGFCLDVGTETVRNEAIARLCLAPARIPSRQK